MTINQISIFLENRTGQLAQICRTLADNDISIVTLSLDVHDLNELKLIIQRLSSVSGVTEVVRAG